MKALIGSCIAHLHQHQIIIAAGHQITFGNFRNRLHRLLKRLDGAVILFIEGHLNEDVLSAPYRVWVQDHSIARYHAFAFKPFETFMACGRRQIDTLGKFGVGQASVFFQASDKRVVICIQFYN